MKLHTTKSKQKQFYHINTEISSWKIPNITIATFRIYIGNISVQSPSRVVACYSYHTYAHEREENMVDKGENNGCPHFLLFMQCFPQPKPCFLSG